MQGGRCLVGGYQLFHRDALDCVKYLFRKKAFDGKMDLKPRRMVDEQGRRQYADWFTGKYVHAVFEAIQEDRGGDDNFTVFLVVVYSDKVHKDVMGWHQSHGMYIYLGNVHTSVRLKGKNQAILIADVPIIKCKHNERGSPRVRRASMMMLHTCLSIVFPPQYVRLMGEGLVLDDAQGEGHFGYIIHGGYVGDNPEVDTINQNYGGWCPGCKWPKHLWNTIPPAGQMEIRTEQEGLSVYQKALRLENQGRHAKARKMCHSKGYQNYSKQNQPSPPVVNATWAWRFFNGHVNCPPDNLHDQGGVTKHIITGVVSAFSLLGPARGDAQNFFDQMFQRMPHFNGLLHFTNGVSHLTGFTGGRWRAVLKVLACVIADIYPIDDFTSTVVSYSDFYIIYTSHVVSEGGMRVAHAALVKMVRHQNNSFFFVSKTELCYRKMHKTLAHAIPAIEQMGAPIGYSAGPMENAHIWSIKVPHRATSGTKAEEQMINYINRHHTFEQMLTFLGLLQEAQNRGYVPGGDWDDEVDGEQQVETTALVNATLRGSRNTLVKVKNYATVHSLGGGGGSSVSSSLQAAYGDFQRSVRVCLYEHQCGEPPPEGERGWVYYLPDLDTHVMEVYPTLQLPLSTHPYVAFSQTMRCLVPGVHNQPTRMDNVAVRCPAEGGGADAICIGQLLLLFQAKFTKSATPQNAPSSSSDELEAPKEETLSLVFLWWYDEDDGGVSDASECTSFKRSYSNRPVQGSTRNQRLPWTEVVPISRVLYRVHMIPKKQEGSWEVSKEKFRLNKWIYLCPS